MGNAMAHLVEIQRSKPEVCGFDSRWCHYKFLLRNSFGRNVALRLNQLQAEMSTKQFRGGKDGQCLTF